MQLNNIEWYFRNGSNGLLLEADPEVVYQRNECKALIDKALVTLTPREEKVMRLIFFEGYTLAEVADSFVVSTDRIRQIKTKALRKLRHPSRKSILSGI